MVDWTSHFRDDRRVVADGICGNMPASDSWDGLILRVQDGKGLIVCNLLQ